MYVREDRYVKFFDNQGLVDVSDFASAGSVRVVPGRARGPGPSTVAGSVAVVVGLGGASVTVLVVATWGWA